MSIEAEIIADKELRRDTDAIIQRVKSLPPSRERSLTIEHIARMCHETNRSWCEINGDTSQQSWNEAALWQRESAMKGVSFAIENPDATPALQHEAWYKDKECNGWMYGPVKDEAKKEHPCMLPYHMLPKQQQIKDRLFLSVVNALKQELSA